MAAAGEAGKAASVRRPGPAVVRAVPIKVRHADSKSINGYLVKHELGEGSFARVKLCEAEDTGAQFAMKIFRKGRLRREREFVGGGEASGMRVKTAMDKVYSEIAIMCSLSHPHCIRLHAVFDDERDMDDKMYAVLELAGRGCAMDWSCERLSYFVPATGGLYVEPTAAGLCAGMLRGLAHLHGLRVAHRDVKPQNVLVADSGIAKLGDFGVAARLDERFRVVGTEGTYSFWAPEMCRSGYVDHDGRLADVWAAGVTLWAFLLGTVPFCDADVVRLLDAIAEGVVALPEDSALSPPARDALRRLLCADTDCRPQCDEALLDPWLALAAAAGEP